MIFTSTIFLFAFLPLTMLLYILVKKNTFRNSVLLLFSLLFYAWGEWRYLLLMIASVAIDYGIAFYISKQKALHIRRLLLLVGIVTNVGMLMYFKYTGFFIQSANALFQFSWIIPNIALPLGISFFTFQAISYLVDVYKTKIPPQRNFAWLLLYITFFPQLVTGPIVRYETFHSDLYNRTLNLNDICAGVERFIIGMGKKVIIANQMAGLADSIYNSDYISTPTMWLAAIAYMLQIYFDFSSYSDMALGLSRMFGFHFHENFNFPYIANSITAFWRRWHISLSSWFRDYIYIPLGGNRCSLARQILNLSIVWIITGFWHGAAWNFILWGLYHFIFLILEKYMLKSVMQKTPNWILHITTLLIVMFGWVLFRASSLQECITWIQYLIVPFTDEQSWPMFITYIAQYGLYLLLAMLFSTPLYDKTKTYILNKAPGSLALKTSTGYVLLMIFFFVSVLYMVNATYNAFIYFKF